MNKKWIYSLLAASLLSASSLPAMEGGPKAGIVSAAAAHTIELSGSSALRGQTVTVSGTFEPNAWVSLRGVDSKDQLVIFEAAKAGSDGRYSFTIVVPASAALGDMQIAAGAGEQVAEAKLAVVSGGGSPGPSVPAGTSTENGKPVTQPSSITGGTISFKIKAAAGADGRLAAVVAIGAAAVKEALAQNGGVIRIQLDTEGAADVSVSLTAEALDAILSAATSGNVMIDIISPLGSYTLPSRTLNREALAASLGVSADQLELRIGMSQATSSQETAIDGAIARIGGEQAAASIDYTVVVSGGERSMPLNLGTAYIERTLPLTAEIDPDRATGVLYDPATGMLSFVPTTFQTENGRTTATIKRNGNSLYTVIENEASFEDLAEDHWGRADIELLASKLVVTGVDADRYDPAALVTRAEFAALIVRALGLDAADGSAFTDIGSGKWYAGAVGAASEAGIVSGYEDGTFRPDRPITRQELAVLVDNALAFTGHRAADISAEQELAAFQDASSIAPWAKLAVAEAVHAGITEGREGGQFIPAANATRAEAAVMIKRLLQHIAFID